MNKKRPAFVPWLISFGIAAAVFVIFVLSRHIFEKTDPKEIYTILCDGFFVPGAFYTCIGILSFCAQGGFFDIFAYGIKSLGVLLTPFRKPEKQMKYFEYKEMKKATRQKTKPCILITGLVFLGLAVVCLLLYSV